MSRNRSCFLIVPIALLTAGGFFFTQMFPIYLHSNGAFGQDPAYMYLFSGVDILQGHTPVHTDHPGTPVQVLIAIVVAIVWGLSYLTGATSLNLFSAVLVNPELYLGAVSITLLVLNAASIYYLARRVYLVTGNYPASLASQMSPLVFGVASPNILYPAPEAMLFCISVCLLGVLAPRIFSSEEAAAINSSAKRDATLAGALCGLGLAVKLTFLPILGLLLLLGSWRLFARAALCVLLAWFAGVLPIIQKLPTMFAWLFSLLTHTGIHGGGEKAMIDVTIFKRSVSWLLAVFPLLQWMLLALAVAIAVGISYCTLDIIRTRSARSGCLKGGNDNDFSRNLRIAATFFLVLAAQTLMVAKHPGPTYMIPVLPVICLSSIWLLLLATQVFTASAAICRLVTIVWCVVLLGMVTVSSIDAYSNLSTDRRRGWDSYQTITHEISKFDHPVLIGAFNCNFPLCALWLGLLVSTDLQKRMNHVEPDFYYFDIFARKLDVPGLGELSHEQTAKNITDLVATNRPVLLISPPFEQLSVLNLEKIRETPVQSLYRVTGVAPGN